MEDPRAGDTVRCVLDVDHVCRFRVSGMVKELPKDRRLALWVQPVSPASETPGWYLQTGFNGITQFNSVTGDFQGVAQIGNPRWPPQAGDILNLAITAISVEEVESLMAERGVVTRRTLPGTTIDLAGNVRVRL